MDISDIVSKSRDFVDDIEKLRCYWESKTHWHVRKTFLLHNWDDFKDKDRLICLSQAWVNVHFCGNRYPQEVMDTLKDMEEGLEPPDKMLRDAEIQVIGIVDDTPRMKNMHDTSKLPHTIFPMRFVKSGTGNTKISDNELSSDQIDEQLSKTKNVNVNKRPNEDEIEDVIEIKRTKVDGNITSQPESQKEIIDKNFTQPTLIMNRVPTMPTDATCVKINLNSEEYEKLKNFIIRKKVNESPLSVIQSSTSFCRISEEYVFEQQYDDEVIKSHSCSLYLGGVLVGKAFANQKKSAKYAAAFSALELLQTTQPTILVSQPGDLDSAISRDDIASKTGSAAGQKISDTNLGNQLLRKMGWKGQGGLGKTGSGISAPVTVKETYGRFGLGVEDIGKNIIRFREADNVIRNYASSQRTDHLTFSPELTNIERAKIHKLAKKYGLRSKSYNKDDIRYLVVSRKMSATALLDELKRSGGNIKGAQLIDPRPTNMQESK
ncbi:uncharacterized protein LOC120329356 [Styela clava]